jgi:hypothetical protein
LPGVAEESGRHIRLGRNLEAVKDKAAAKSSNKKKKTEDHGSRFAELTSFTGDQRCIDSWVMSGCVGYVFKCLDLLLDDHSPAMFCYGNIKYEGFKTVLI